WIYPQLGPSSGRVVGVVHLLQQPLDADDDVADLVDAFSVRPLATSRVLRIEVAGCLKGQRRVLEPHRVNVFKGLEHERQRGVDVSPARLAGVHGRGLGVPRLEWLCIEAHYSLRCPGPGRLPPGAGPFSWPTV